MIFLVGLGVHVIIMVLSVLFGRWLVNNMDNLKYERCTYIYGSAWIISTLIATIASTLLIMSK